MYARRALQWVNMRKHMTVLKTHNGVTDVKKKFVLFVDINGIKN